MNSQPGNKLTTKVGAIVLAAGSSKRFNGDKRRSILDSGKSLLETSIENAASHFTQTLVVLRSGDSDYARELNNKLENKLADSGISYFCAPDSALGMAHSLGNAISTLKQWQAAAIFLGDMPYLEPETIQTLLTTYEKNGKSQPIVVPVMVGNSEFKSSDIKKPDTKNPEKSKYGHPVIFDQVYFAAIASLEGDVGARAVINANRDRVIEVVLDDSGVIRDIDRKF